MNVIFVTCVRESQAYPMKSSKVKDSLTICNKLKKKNTLSDTKMKPIRLPPLTSTSKKSQELLEVQALPSDWVPDTRPSKVVQNLLQKRKEEHEGVVEKMRNSMGDVNDQVENDIGVAAVIYKQTLQESKKDVDGCLQSIRQMLKGPSNLAITNFSAAIDDIVSIYRSNKHNLFNLLQKLKGLEKFRCEAFQRFLREAYIKLNQISYSTPFEIQLFFEQEIQAINEMTLSNIRGYTELKAHLKLQLQNEIRLLLCEIQYLRENWFYYIKYTLFTTLNRDKLFGKDCNQEALGINTAVTEEDECSTCTDWGNESTINVNKMYQWVNKIENVMNHMDTCAKKLVGSFKEAIIKIVASYFDDMRKAIQTILDLGIIENWEVKMVQAEFCGQAVVDVTGKYTEELANLQELWAGSKRELQTCLEDAFVFLKSFSDIWSMHFRRVNEIKSIVAKDLLRVIRDGFLLVCAEEMKINIKIDSLRQESNKKILEEGADSVAKYLDNLKDLYIQNQKKESAIVENIKDLAGLEAELLESELMYFLQRYYGKSSSINEKPSRRNSDVCSANDEIESHNSKAEPAKTLLAGEIRMCNRQIGLLQHWKSGLHTVIIKYVNKCKEESAILASVWINTEKSKSLLRLRLIEVVHAARFNRLTPLITDLRLAEIERMYARFEEHKADVEQEISNMALIFPRYEIKYTQILEECETVVGQIKNRAVNAKNSATVTSEISYLQNIITSGMEKIAKVSEAYQADASLRICQILKFNLLYVKALRLFSEGGNFSLNAAKDICNELSKIEKQYKKQITSLSHENDKKYSKCLQKLGNTKFQVTGFLCKYEDELKHCDNYIYALKDVQVELKKEVYQIKLKGKQLRASMKNLWEMGEKSVGEPQKLQRFVRHANKCIQIIEENEFALKRPLVRKGSSNVSMKQSVTRQSTSLSLAIGKLQSKIKNSMTYTDYSLFLFDTVPRKENSFIGKTRYLLYMSYKNLQKEAKDFYDSHAQATIINEEKIHRTYQEFVSDTLPKYVYYYLQCELIWLEEANAFLQTIDKILPNLRKLRIDSLRKYAEIYFKELKEAFHTIYAELNNIKSDSKNKFLSLYKKLMPLHGYPRNSKLLEDLNKQMEQFFQKQAEIYVNPVNKHKEHFNDKELQFTVGLFQINDSIVAVEASYEDKSYNRLISFELLETLLHLRKFVILPQDIYLEESVLQNVAKKIEFYKKNIIIPPEYLLNVSASSLLCNSPRDNSSFITIRLEDFMTKKLEVYTQQKEELIENIASIVEENKFNIGIWQDMWDKAVENVTGLYKVKYDQPAV